MKIKILFLGRFSPPLHGAAKMNELFFSYLSGFKDIEIRKIKLNFQRNLRSVGKVNIDKVIGTIVAFVNLLKQLTIFKPEIIYFEIAPRGFAFFRDSLCALICKAFNKKIVYHIHARNFIRSNYAKFVFKDTKTIIISELLYQNIKPIVSRKDVYVLNNGIIDKLHRDEFRHIIRDRMRNTEANLLFLSNMIESKGSIETLKICNKLKLKNVNFKCIFAGSWPDSKTKKRWCRIRKYFNLQSECEYLGLVKGNEKKKVLSKSDILIFPTRYEHECFPLVILEAMMYGIPVLTYNTGAIIDIIKNEYLGFISENNNCYDLVDEIQKRIKQRTDYCKIRDNFLRNYQLSDAGEKLKVIFKDLLRSIPSS